MSVPAQNTTVGFGLQAAEIGRGGTFTPGDVDFYKVRTVRSAAVPVQSQQVFPPELGGVLTPAGAYKDMAFFGGDADLLPRLEGSLGVLLKAALGDLATTTDEDSEGNAVTGMYAHTFKFASDQSSLPFLAIRELVPQASGNFGITAHDCRVSSLRLTVPAMGKLAARVVFQGREFAFDDGSGWTWANATFEKFTSTPDAGSGFFKIAGTEYENVIGVQFELNNGLTRPQDEMNVGDFFPGSSVPLQRAATMRVVFRWQDDELYRSLYTGAVDGTAFSPLPFIQETGGSNAFEMKFTTPEDVAATTPTTPFGLHVIGNAITWAAQPLELRGGGIVTQTCIATLLTPTTGDYVNFILQNGNDGTMYA